MLPSVPFPLFSSSFAVNYAFALAVNRVRVAFSTAPLASARTVPGSAMNPASWGSGVQRLDTGAYLPIAAVEQVDALTFDLTLGANLGAANVQHRVTAATVVNVDCTGVSPDSADIAGLFATAGATSDPPPSDFRNWSAPRNPAGGTLQIGTDGDYRMESGVEYERKMIIRRLTTDPGGFFYLPDYGAGIATKRNYSTAALPRLQRELQRQVMLEPSVASAQVTVTLHPGQGILNIVVAAKLRNGQQLTAQVSQETQ